MIYISFNKLYGLVLAGIIVWNVYLKKTNTI